MNKLSKLLILLAVIAMLVGCLAACKPDNTPDENGDGTTETPGDSETGGGAGGEIEFVDYASQVKFNPNSGKAHAEVEVKSYIDGDTTHFFIDNSIIPEGYVKARYLGINTPESTGIIEPWGKKASNYTKTQLQKATSIIIESDTANWDLDSTGGRGHRLQKP